MTLIEGIGDEVTVFAVVLVLLSVLLVAWVSTNVSDRPLVSVIVLDGRTFQHFISRLRGRRVTTPGDTRQQEGSAAEQTGADAITPQPSTSSDDTNTQPAETEAERNSAEVQNSEINSETVDNTHQGAAQTDGESPTGESSSTAASTPGSEGFIHIAATGDTDNNASALLRPEQVSASQPPPCEPSSTELRQRRLAFFNNPQQADTESSQTSPTVHQEQAAPEQGETTTSQTSPDTTEEEMAGQSEAYEHLDGHIRIRIKYLDDRQRWVQARPEETIGQFKRAHFRTEMNNNTMVRFIYNGRELTSDGQSLASYNISDDSVIHCLVSRITRPDGERPQPGGVMFDVGTLVFPLFGLILALLWYSRFTYKQYFNTISTLTLVGISFMFVVALLASFRNNDMPETNESD